MAGYHVTSSSAGSEGIVASLLIRNVDDALRAHLEARARAHHRSVEEEARETLRTALARDASEGGPENLMDIARRIFGPERGVDLDLPSRGADASRLPPDFSGNEYDR
jgi:plasmid stability protein